jgi:hypothetical protein
MSGRISVVFLVTAYAAASLFGVISARAGDQRVWTLSGLDPKWHDDISLTYGVPETDDTLGTFRCALGSGMVTLFISTTSSRLRPGRSEMALLSVGETRARIAGRLLPNEEAGVPSFEGRFGAGAPILAALAAGDTMRVTVGVSRQSAPLAGSSDKFRKFAAACAKQ